MIYVALTFRPNQKNPARASGRGVWRVADSGTWPDVQAMCPSVVGDWLFIGADREYKPGSRVDPAKLALRGLAAAQ